jgi:hypothetical protein
MGIAADESLPSKFPGLIALGRALECLRLCERLLFFVYLRTKSFRAASMCFWQVERNLLLNRA